MAHKAKDGQQFTNRSAMLRHERRSPTDSTKGNVAHDNGREHDEPGMHDGEDVHAVVAEHGPAKEVTVKHDKDKHHVHSKHEDGHEHNSDHDSAQEAHDSAACLGGCGSEDENEGSEEGESDGIPGLSY